MFKNHLKIAWRNMMKNKTFSFINIFGLSIGFSCCMLIGLYIKHERSYDQHHEHVKQLYQLGTVFIRQGKEDRSANTPGTMAGAMQQEFPEIAKTTRLIRAFAEDKTLFQYTPPGAQLRSFYETDGFIADSTFFQLFTYNFKEGDPATALTEPNTLVLSEEIAEKIFGKEPPLGKVVHISSTTNGDNDYKVTGVFKPGNAPTHINARFFMSLNGGDIQRYIRAQPNNLVNNNMLYTYFELKPGSDAKKLEAKFPAFIEKYAGNDLRAMGMYKKQFLVPVKDIHLYANTSSNVTPAGSTTYLYILASIAVFVLLIACINFMNLSTARSTKRSAEVGVRKVLGAERSSLVRQFLGESVLMALIAFIFACIFALLLLPMFGQVSGKALSFSFGRHGGLLAMFAILALITGLLAGSYPAFYLSSFKPVKVLKGKIANTLAVVSLRKGLVVFQFVISVMLIIASVVINKQLHYMQTTDLGFEKDQQVVIPLRSNASKKISTALKGELARIPQVTSVGASMYYPGIFNPRDMPVYKEGLSMNESKRLFVNLVDDNFLQTLGIKPVAGRLYSKAYAAADTNSAAPRIIINEEAAKQLGFANAQDAANKNVMLDFQGRNYKIEVIGVVKDFHFKDLHSAIEPYGFELNNSDTEYNYVIAHIAAADAGNVLRSAEKIWRDLNRNEPFEYSFLDEDFKKNYNADVRLSALVRYFTIIAILISCLGLFGLVTFSAEQRTKEIGIRKVLGAGVPGIIGLLSKDFLKLVIIALIIASPMAWYFMNKWLQDFAYQTHIGWWVFAVTGIVAVLIALATISFQAVKAALANPVRALRSE